MFLSGGGCWSRIELIVSAEISEGEIRHRALNKPGIAGMLGARRVTVRTNDSEDRTHE
jgi:hypothetical protein